MLKYIVILAVLSFQAIANSPPATLVLAYEPEHLNHSQSENATPVAKQLADSLGVELVYFQCPWARCIKAAQLGQIDIIDHLFQSEARKDYLTFLNPPYSQYEAKFRFYGLKQANHNVRNLNQLAALTIGAVRGNVYYDQFDNNNEIKKIYSVSENQLIDMVLLGRIDGFIASATMTNDMLRRWDPAAKLTELPYQHTEQKGVHIAVSKKSQWQRHIALLESHLQKLVTAKINQP